MAWNKGRPLQTVYTAGPANPPPPGTAWAGLKSPGRARLSVCSGAPGSEGAEDKSDSRTDVFKYTLEQRI